jgi:hypothetical protein
LLKISLLSFICQGKYKAIFIPNLLISFLIIEKYWEFLEIIKRIALFYWVVVDSFCATFHIFGQIFAFSTKEFE